MVLMGEAVSFFFEYMHTATGSSGASRPRIIFAFRLVRLIVRNKVLLFPSLPTSSLSLSAGIHGDTEAPTGWTFKTPCFS